MNSKPIFNTRLGFIILFISAAIIFTSCTPLVTPESGASITPDIPPSPTQLLPEDTATMKSETPTPTPIEPGLQSLIERAKEDLAQRLGISTEEIEVLEARSVVWPDASLGCPQKGMEYAQVLTPGYLILLAVDSEEYGYHASRGTELIYCVNPQSPVPGTPGDV